MKSFIFFTLLTIFPKRIFSVLQPPSRLPTNSPFLPSVKPSFEPSLSPIILPTNSPSNLPSKTPNTPSRIPTCAPTVLPSSIPTYFPSFAPNFITSDQPSFKPTFTPSSPPSSLPTYFPSNQPIRPSCQPSIIPTCFPSVVPSNKPTVTPSFQPSCQPTIVLTGSPSTQPIYQPSITPTVNPSFQPSFLPTVLPTISPSAQPSYKPTNSPTLAPSNKPSSKPSFNPSGKPTLSPNITPSTRTPTTLTDRCNQRLNPTSNLKGSKSFIVLQDITNYDCSNGQCDAILNYTVACAGQILFAIKPLKVTFPVISGVGINQISYVVTFTYSPINSNFVWTSFYDETVKALNVTISSGEFMKLFCSQSSAEICQQQPSQVFKSQAAVTASTRLVYYSDPFSSDCTVYSCASTLGPCICGKIAPITVATSTTVSSNLPQSSLIAILVASVACVACCVAGYCLCHSRQRKKKLDQNRDALESVYIQREVENRHFHYNIDESSTGGKTYRTDERVIDESAGRNTIVNRPMLDPPKQIHKTSMQAILEDVDEEENQATFGHQCEDTQRNLTTSAESEELYYPRKSSLASVRSTANTIVVNPITLSDEFNAIVSHPHVSSAPQVKAAPRFSVDETEDAFEFTDQSRFSVIPKFFRKPFMW